MNWNIIPDLPQSEILYIRHGICQISMIAKSAFKKSDKHLYSALKILHKRFFHFSKLFQRVYWALMHWVKEHRGFVVSCVDHMWFRLEFTDYAYTLRSSFPVHVHRNEYPIKNPYDTD